MTITYTNEVSTNVLDPLMSLIRAEFKPVDVVFEQSFDPQWLRRGEYIRVWLEGSTVESMHSDGETRQYEFSVVYYFDEKRHRIKTAFDSMYSDSTEHLKRLLENNVSYDDGTYRWHDLRIDLGPVQGVAELEDIEEEDTMAQRMTVFITRNNFR